MRLFTKIFFCSMLVFSVAFQMAGYLLMRYSYENAIAQEKKYALSQFQYNKYVVQSAIYTNGQLEMLGQQQVAMSELGWGMSSAAGLYCEDGTELYSNLADVPAEEFFHETQTEAEKLQESGENAVVYRVLREDEGGSILACGQLTQNERRYFLVIETDISSTIDNQKTIMEYFQKLYLVILGFGLILIWILALVLTRPINRISKMAKRIADGNYKERISASGRDEIGELAQNFNQMAQTIEEKIEELSDAARQREDFVSNFAHEMKTPLTSVIGYADMLYQKELPRNAVRDAAGYILREGMRLETLSLKLMELTVLNRQEFSLECLQAEDVFRDMKQSVQLLCADRGATLHMEITPYELWVEYDLLKTLLLNLIDNALKADCRDIWITGEAEEDGGFGTVRAVSASEGTEEAIECGYRIAVRDNGRGIPAAEIGRITEAFYMVDKSRSRNQHGAGLGLALAERIAKIHGSSLIIESDGASGTTVSFRVKREEAAYEQK